jgi:hypothetical protein
MLEEVVSGRQVAVDTFGNHGDKSDNSKGKTGRECNPIPSHCTNAASDSLSW